MNGIDGLPLTVTGSLNVTASDTSLPVTTGAANAVTLGPTASTTALGNEPVAARLASLPAASRIAAPPESWIGPAARTPAGAASPAWTATVNTSASVPPPLPLQVACRTRSPIAIGSVGVPVTATFSVNFTVNASVLPAA